MSAPTLLRIHWRSERVDDKGVVEFIPYASITRARIERQKPDPICKSRPIQVIDISYNGDKSLFHITPENCWPYELANLASALNAAAMWEEED